MAISSASNQIVKVNLVPGIIPSVLYLSQYDTGAGRPVTFSVYDGSQAFTIPSGVSIAFEGTKPDGNGFSFTCTKSGSSVLLTNYTNQMTALSGKIMCQLVFTDTSGGRVGSLPVLMVVTPAGINGDTVISDSDIEAIVAAQNQYAILNAKLDNAISAATQDSEVQDIRVKADGTSAATAGNAVREQFTELKNELYLYNAYNLIPINYNNSSLPTGINYVSNGDGSYTANGTATENAHYDIYNNLNGFPDGITAGGTYNVDFEKSNGDGLLLIYIVINGTMQPSALLTLRQTGKYVLAIPSDANGIVFRLRIPSGKTATNEMFRVAILTAKANAELETELSAISEKTSALENSVYNSAANLSQYNAVNLIPINTNNTVASGVTYTSNKDGSYTVNGTATENAHYVIYNNANQLPEGIEAGGTYSMEYYSSASVGYIQIYAYTNGVLGQSPFVTFYTTKEYTITIPSDATGLMIRYRTPSGETANNVTFSLTALNAKSNEELDIIISAVSEKTINLFDYDHAKWISNNATIDKLADGKSLRITALSEGTYKYVYCTLDVRGINTIYVQSDTCICSIPYQTTTPRIRIGSLNNDLSFNAWLGDTQFGKSIDVSGCDYICVALHAIYAVSSPAGTYVNYTNVMITNGDVRKSYIDAGWSAIDLVSRTPYNLPSYYFADDYIDGKVARINELCEGCMANGDAFIFMTDQHWRLNAQNSPALVKYIFEHTNINRMFMGGDLCNGGSDLEFFAANKAYQNAFDGEINYAVGNHEYLHTSLNDNNLSYWLYMRNGNRVYGDYARHYYYIDNDAQKIRYIVLSAYQYSGSSSSSVIGYEEAQQTWLQNIALGTLGSGWTAIIITHMLYMVTAGTKQDTDSVSLPGSCTAIADIIANYDGDGEIACVIQGHTHLDKITEVRSSGIPVIVTTCDKYADGTRNNTDLPRQTRTHATLTEQAFDVIVVNKTARKITAVRIGAPALNGVGSAWGTEVQEREVTY